MIDIEAITLDLDNTLWNVYPTIEQAEKNNFLFMQRNYPEIANRYSIEDIRHCRDHVYSTRTEIQHDLTEVRKLALDYVFQSCGYTEEQALTALNLFLQDRNRVKLYSDVIPALEKLSSVYPLVALSDGNSDLDLIGISQYFSATVYASVIGHCKPHPAGFLQACEIAGTKPSKTLHIGDHPEKDIAGAKSVGMKTMLIKRNDISWNQDCEPDFRVNSLTETVSILL